MQPGDDGCIVLQFLAAGICLQVKIDGGEIPAGLPGTAERLPMLPGNRNNAAASAWATPGVSASAPSEANATTARGNLRCRSCRMRTLRKYPVVPPI